MTHRDDLYYQAAQDDWRGCCARPEEALLLLTLDLGGRASCTPAMDLNCASNKHEILSNVEPNTNSFQTPVGYSYSGTLDGSIKKKGRNDKEVVWHLPLAASSLACQAHAVPVTGRLRDSLS